MRRTKAWVYTPKHKLATEVCRGPAGDGYRTHTVHARGDSLTPAALPDLTVRVDEILG